MDRLAFAADEHVPSAYRSTLRSNGFAVDALPTERRGQTSDAALLDWSTDRSLVLLTNDRDFVDLGADRHHAGIVLYTSYDRPPGAVARGIRRIDRQFTPATIADEMLWLADWV